MIKSPTATRTPGGYVYRWLDPDFIEIEIGEVRRKSDEWKGLLIVRKRVPGSERTHLVETSHTLSAAQSRSTLARTLAENHALQNGNKWSDYLEMACVLAMRSERTGEPFQRVGNLPEDQRPHFWLLERYMRLHQVTSLFADGATGKSTLAVLWALSVLTGQELAGFQPAYSGPVIWLDWESDEWDIDDTIKCICQGHSLPTGLEFDYRRETWPLTQTYQQVSRQVAQTSAALVVIDSAGYAIGGDSEKASDVLAYTRALRALGTTVLTIDHIVKGDSKGKAFGSVYKFNEVRQAFELERSQEEGSNESIIRVKCRKANKGGWPPEVFLKAVFEEGSIHYERTDPVRMVDEHPEAKGLMGVKARIRAALGRAPGLMNAEWITDEVDRGVSESKQAGIAQVKARLSDMLKDKEIVVSAPKGEARRYALRSDREG